jgi:hypothetical protein
MPRKHRYNRKTFRGGFSLTDSWGNLTQGASSWWGSTKSKIGMGSSSSPTTSYGSYGDTSGNTQNYGDTSGTTQNYGDTSGTTQTYGGKSKKRRTMRGGYKSYTPTTGLAGHGASFSGQTAKPHTLVGGKTRKRCRGGKHRHSKSCKHRKH